MDGTLRVNGTDQTVAVEPRRTLLDSLRHDLRLTGTKKVCDMGDCGACSVLVDGRAMYSCLLLAVDCRDRAITTIEGLSGPTEDGDNLNPVQRAFVEADVRLLGQLYARVGHSRSANWTTPGCRTHTRSGDVDRQRLTPMAFVYKVTLKAVDHPLKDVR